MVKIYLSLSFMRKIREVNQEKSELESQLTSFKLLSMSSQSSRSNSFDQHSVASSMTESVMFSNASVISVSSVDDRDVNQLKECVAYEDGK
jgi:hypothetical protein